MHIYDPIAIAKSHLPFDFQEIAPFNDAGFGVFQGTGLDTSAWEIHRDTDEWLMVLEGSVTVEILTDTDRHLVPLNAGQFTVVPRGHWHRHTKVQDVVEMFLMPGSEEESTADDPRVEASTEAST